VRRAKPDPTAADLSAETVMSHDSAPEIADYSPAASLINSTRPGGDTRPKKRASGRSVLIGIVQEGRNRECEATRSSREMSTGNPMRNHAYTRRHFDVRANGDAGLDIKRADGDSA
jgi:hypothetical protein